MMNLNIQGGDMRIDDNGTVSATPNIIKDIVNHYKASDGNDGRKKPEVLEIKD